jgi:hypothetical protein
VPYNDFKQNNWRGGGGYIRPNTFSLNTTCYLTVLFPVWCTITCILFQLHLFCILPTNCISPLFVHFFTTYKLGSFPFSICNFQISHLQFSCLLHFFLFPWSHFLLSVSHYLFQDFPCLISFSGFWTHQESSPGLLTAQVSNNSYVVN